MTTRSLYEMDNSGSFPAMRNMGEALPNDHPPPYSDTKSPWAQNHKEHWQAQVQYQAHPGQSMNPPPRVTRPYIPAFGVLLGYAGYDQPLGPHVVVQTPPYTCPSDVKQPYQYPPPPAINYVPPPPPSQIDVVATSPDSLHVHIRQSASLTSALYMSPPDHSHYNQPSLHRPHSQIFYPPPVDKPAQACQTLYRPQSQIFTPTSQYEAPPMTSRPQSVYTPSELSSPGSISQTRISHRLRVLHHSSTQFRSARLWNIYSQTRISSLLTHYSNIHQPSNRLRTSTQSLSRAFSPLKAVS